MRNLVFIILAAFSFVFWTTDVSAYQYVIEDNYIGADPNHDSYDGKDRIGDYDWFEITRMGIDIVNGNIVVDISSTYFDNIGKYYTELGDLFISTNGYSPTSPSSNDYYFNGEKWEYVLALDDHSASGGDLNVYAFDSSIDVNNDGIQDDIKLSWAPDNYIYRAGQEVQYQGSGSSLAQGSWSISDDNTLLRMTAPMYGTGHDWRSVEKFGFHWTMSCANDVIEGSIQPTPEPATMFLVGAGLLGIGGLGRSRLLNRKSRHS